MRYYKTGEFAKMANVSIRTIRWYDKQGLLKPTMIAENGYRLYTDKDFVKLQQILSLKQLGFSLEEIFSMTLNDDVNSLMQSLELQSTLIEGKINHLLAIQSAIEETKNVLSDKQDIDWNQLIKLIKMTSMNDSVVEQYRDSSNLEIRIRLHERYSVNQETWFSWLFRQYHLENGMKVLEVGCGNGELWKKNAAAIPDASITLSDISEGMVNDAKENLEHVANMRYACFDVEDIPYDDATFDVVIANHVLFYIKDLPAALNEIYRVLKPEGVFYASSYGHKHMHEITDLVKEFDTRITLSNINLYDIFGLENGEQLLSRFFARVELLRHEDALEVTNRDDLSNYILSCHGNQGEYISKKYDEFRKFLDRKLAKTKSFHITKDAGMFICQKVINDERKV